MGTFTTALGDEYTLERRLPRLGWKPEWHGSGDGPDLVPDLDVGDADGILAVLALALLAIALVVILLPLLLFVAEAALVVALIIPLTLIGLALGVVTHEVVLRRGSGDDAPVIARREARGVLSSYRAKRQLRSDAEAGEFRGLTAPAASPGLAAGGSVPPGGAG